MRFALKHQALLSAFWGALLCLPAAAHHCYLNKTEVDFGKVDPLRIEGVSTIANIQLNCYSITSPTFYCLVLQGAAAERILSLNKDTIPFNFYHGGTKIVWGGDGSGQAYFGSVGVIKGKPTQFPVINFDAILGRPDGLSLQKGRYSGKFTTQVYGAYGKSELTEAEKQDLCRGTKPKGVVTFTERKQNLTVYATIEKSCSITAGSINFGRVPRLESVKPAVGAVKVRCYSPTDYEIGLDMGQNGINGARAMKCATAESCGARSIAYNLYQDSSHTQIWGSEWGTDRVVKGQSANTIRAANVYARLLPGQKDADSGTYKDSVVATIQWQ